MAKKKDVWSTNYASDEEIRSMVQKLFVPKIMQVRSARTDFEDHWTRFYNMWNVIHDDAHLYHNRAKLYVPEVRKNVEAQARQLVDSAFPNDDYVDCLPGAGGTRKGAQLQKALRRWQIEQSQLPLKFHIFARQQCLYGTSAAYICWDHKVETAFKSSRHPKTGKITPTKKLVELYKGPDFRVRDLFKWYALNPKKAEIDEEGCFDIQVLNRVDLEELSKQGLLWGLQDVLSGNSDAYTQQEMNKDIQRAENLGLHILQNQAYTGLASLEDKDLGKNGTYMKTTLYARVKLPKACLEDEDPELGIPMKIEIFNNEHVTFVGRNPFFHQRPPYVVGKYIPPGPDEFYGQGIPQATQYMQYEINAKAEQAMDSVTYALNPIAFIDPALAAQDGEFEIEPGAKWFVNPAGAKFSAMPDVSAAGYNAISLLKSQIQDYADRTPSLPPQFAGKARTATQADIVQNIISLDIKSFQRQNELMVLQPMMEMWESLTDQNGDEQQMVMILGKDSTEWRRLLVSKNEMLGNYRYFWRVSTSLQNKQIAARQILDAMKVAASLPPDAQQKLNFNFSEAFRTLWTEYWDLKNASDVMNTPDGLISQDPGTILEMLKLGMEVEVLPGDDDAAIMRFLDETLKETKDKFLSAEIVKQILLHQKQLEQKRQQMMQQQMMFRQQMMMNAQAAAQGQGQRGRPGAQGSGNRTQLSPNGSAGNMASGTRA
jgi:hypothetical protein